MYGSVSKVLAARIACTIDWLLLHYHSKSVLSPLHVTYKAVTLYDTTPAGYSSHPPGGTHLLWCELRSSRAVAYAEVLCGSCSSSSVSESSIKEEIAVSSIVVVVVVAAVVVAVCAGLLCHLTSEIA